MAAAIGLQIGQFMLRRDAEKALQQTNEELDARVRERTAELRKANRELFSQVAERNRLEGEILNISEHERRRFGQDLHDSICQQLSGIALMAHAVGEGLRKRSDPEAKNVDAVAQLVSAAVAHARDLARGLHPV